jgi:plasmid stabilization system protein ParE
VAARRFRFHPAAELELTEAADWYEERRAGLGAELVASVRGKVEEIIEAPGRWRAVGDTRRAPLGRFPYVIVYRELPQNEIEIVAIAHYRRRPNYWARR